MAVQTTLASLSQTASANGPDGGTDAPSTLDDAIRYHGQFIAKVRDDAIAFGMTTAGGTPTATAAELQLARNSLSVSTDPFRNRVINNDMSVDQRNSAVAQTITAAAVLAYCVDMHYAYCTGANVTGQQIIAADSRNRYRFTGAASVTAVGFGHRIEARNSRDLASTVCTLSAKLSSSSLTTVNWSAFHANTADTFGTLASPTRTSIASGSFTINSTETVYSTQITMPAGATTGIEIVFTVGALLAAATWTIGDVQLEKGTILTAAIVPEVVDATTQLARCQRYFEKSWDSVFTVLGGSHHSVASTSFILANGSVRFTVRKRLVPTIGFISPASGAGVAAAEYNTAGTFTADRSPALTEASTGGFEAGIAGTATVGNQIRFHWSASSVL